jgi:hypothetical protein
MEQRARAEVERAGLEIPVKLVAGGAERQDSVRIALAITSAESEVVVIHDAARPLATPAMFAACLDAVRRVDGAIAAIAVADTLKRTDDRNSGDRAVRAPHRLEAGGEHRRRRQRTSRVVYQYDFALRVGDRKGDSHRILALSATGDQLYWNFEPDSLDLGARPRFHSGGHSYDRLADRVERGDGAQRVVKERTSAERHEGFRCVQPKPPPASGSNDYGGDSHEVIDGATEACRPRRSSSVSGGARRSKARPECERVGAQKRGPELLPIPPFRFSR